MIIYTPLDIPKIEPNNWDEWWDVWNNHAGATVRTKPTHNTVSGIPWKGLDIYKTFDVHSYNAPMAPQTPVVLDLVEQVKKYCTIKPILIRVIENLIPIEPHTDTLRENNYQFRSVLWNTYKSPIWKFTYKNEVKDMILPSDTNSFYYLDHPVTHSCIYDPSYSKGLLLVFGPPVVNVNEIVNRSVEKYKDVAWIV